MIPAWLPILVPWAGAALLAALPRRPLALGPVVGAASLAAAAALVFGGDAGRGPDALAAALLLAGAVASLLAALADAGAGRGASAEEGRFVAAGFPLLQGAQALALIAGDSAVAWIGLAVGAAAGAALVALTGGRRGVAAAWSMLLLCGAGLALALVGVVLLRVRGVAGMPPPGLSGLGFVLLLVGYGALAGLAPLNAWLPRAIAVSQPPVAMMVAGLLLPTALHALFRFAASAGVPATGLLAAVGLATALLAASAAWRRPFLARAFPGWGAAGLAGLAALGFGLGGAAGDLAGVLLLLALPFSVGAAVLGSEAGGPVAGLGRLSLAGMPPFAPFVALLLLFSTVAALPAGLALPLGVALLLAAAAQLGAAARAARGGGGALPASGAPRAGRGGLLVVGPPWLLLFFVLVLGAMLPERVAAALAEAARLVR
jgi:hydrogenase-4 component F